jgi:8-oxo-dGTP pyrophosphatase MutT (NUDIX family)
MTGRPLPVLAAGGVVWRRRGGTVEVLLVHRPRYDDWSLPKGKALSDEGAPDAALREVEEETGLRCRLGRRLATSVYRDRRGRPKVVRYWAMTPVGGDFAPGPEVDRVQWVAAADAAGVVSYDGDRTVMASLLEGSGLTEDSGSPEG